MVKAFARMQLNRITRRSAKVIPLRLFVRAENSEASLAFDANEYTANEHFALSDAEVGRGSEPANEEKRECSPQSEKRIRMRINGGSFFGAGERRLATLLACYSRRKLSIKLKVKTPRETQSRKPNRNR